MNKEEAKRGVDMNDIYNISEKQFMLNVKNSIENIFKTKEIKVKQSPYSNSCYFTTYNASEGENYRISDHEMVNYDGSIDHNIITCNGIFTEDMIKINKERKQESDKILDFIKNWERKNPFNWNAEELNIKFKKDFEAFFDASIFKYEKKEFYLKRYELI